MSDQSGSDRIVLSQINDDDDDDDDDEGSTNRCRPVVD